MYYLFLESPRTKAYSYVGRLALFAIFSKVHLKNITTHGDLLGF
jgi:hypothetical protein